MEPTVDLSNLERCFGGAIPAVLCTAAADGTPNVTYLSKAHRVDGERIALSNQFMSKTAKNLATNPNASLLLLDPITYNQYRLGLVFERTERRGPVFERLRHDVEAIAALTGMTGVFRLRAADVFRVTHIERTNENEFPEPDLRLGPADAMAGLAAITARVGRAGDLDTLVDVALDGIVEFLAYEHVNLFLVDETGRTLYTIASRGFDAESVGAEVAMGDGVVGTAAERCQAINMGNVGQMQKYSRAMRREYVDRGGTGPGEEIPVAGLPDAQSRLAVPALALGQLVGVLVVERREHVAFDDTDEQLLGIVASILASAIEHARALAGDEETVADPIGSVLPSTALAAPTTTVRHFRPDGSTFVDGDYLIKGVAGRILWSLLVQHTASGRIEFTNRELRLDPTLELPEFKDNLESRLVLLKRRLDERDAPIRMERTGRGRFRLLVDHPIRLDSAEA